MVTPLVKLQCRVPSIMEHLNNEFGGLRSRGRFEYPDFGKCETVACFSDYAGDNQDSKYDAYTFIIVDYVSLHGWRHALQHVRQQGWRDLSYFEYKKLHKDKCRTRLLSNYLDAADYMHGIVISVLIHKSIDWFLGGRAGKILFEEGLGEWKDRLAERLLRVVHLCSLLLAGFARQQNKVFWQTDRDPITEGMGRMDNVREVFRRVLNMYSGHDYKLIGIAKKFEVRRGVEDYHRHLLSVPDLVSGALLDLINHSNKSSNDTIKSYPQIKSVPILRWMGNESATLKRVILKVERDLSGEGYDFCTSFIKPAVFYKSFLSSDGQLR